MKLENIDFNGKSYNLRIDRYASSNFIAILMGEPNDKDINLSDSWLSKYNHKMNIIKK